MCYRPPRNGGAEKVTSSFEVLSELAIMLAFVVVGTWPYAISSRLAWPARARVRRCASCDGDIAGTIS